MGEGEQLCVRVDLVMDMCSKNVTFNVRDI